MEDPFKVGLKAFFGVATGFGILVLTFGIIQSIDYTINEFIENQEQKERERKEKIRIEKERIERERIERKRIERKRIERERIERERIERKQREKKYQEQERIKRLNYFKETGKPYRPAWMEEKIKECYAYSTKKERDYCIDVYSPFGK